MLLSYWLRLVCLLLFSLGLIQAALSLLLQLLAPALDRVLARLSPRWRERACFVLPLTPHLAAFMLVALAIAPQYIGGETNLLDERVAIACIAGALLAAARYAYALLRALRMIGGCPPAPNKTAIAAAAAIAAGAPGVPVQIAESAYPVLMVTGLLRPAITVSRRLLDRSLLSPEALEVAFAHELAHLRQWDNLKLFMLSSLALPGRGGAIAKRWRRAAEIAADSDAAAGSRARATLLAETLLVTAGAVPPQQALAPLALGLRSHEEDLQIRILRLIGEKPESAVHAGRLSLLAASLLLLCGASLLFPLALVPFHGVAECLLHL
ncbi:MAG: hypothetical protein ACRD3N_15355 [Terracidiphilus sp.]